MSGLVVWERAFRHYPPEEMHKIEKLPGRARRLAFLHALRGLEAGRALELARTMLRASPMSFSAQVAWAESLAQVYDWCFDALGALRGQVSRKINACAVGLGPSTAAEAASAAAALVAAGAALGGEAGKELFGRGGDAVREALEDIASVPLDGLEALARAERVARVCCEPSLGVREKLQGLELPSELPPAVALLLGRSRGPHRGDAVYGLVFAVRTWPRPRTSTR